MERNFSTIMYDESPPNRPGSRSPGSLPLLVFCFAVMLILAHRGWTLLSISQIPADFEVYWEAARRLGLGESLYRASDPSPFKYSPTFALVFASTLSHFDRQVAAALWGIASACSFWGVLASFVLRCLQVASQPRQIAVALIGSTLLSWHGTLETLSYGQADLFVAAGFLVVLQEVVFRPKLDRTQKWVVALTVSVVLLTKPHAALALLPLAWILDRGSLTWVISALGFGLSLPLFWLGPQNGFELYRSWIHCLQIQQDVPFLTNNINQSLAAVIARVSNFPEIVKPLSTLMVVLYAAILFLVCRQKSVRATALGRLHLFGLSLASYLIAAPLSWRWGIFLWIPITLILAIPEGSRRIAAIWILLGILTHPRLESALGFQTEDLFSFLGNAAIVSLALWAAALVAVRKQIKIGPPL